MLSNSSATSASYVFLIYGQETCVLLEENTKAAKNNIAGSISSAPKSEASSSFKISTSSNDDNTNASGAQ